MFNHSLRENKTMQFDYVTGVLFAWTVGGCLIFATGLFTLARLLQKNDRLEDNFDFTQRMNKFDTRLRGIEQLWIDSQKKKH